MDNNLSSRVTFQWNLLSEYRLKRNTVLCYIPLLLLLLINRSR